MRDRNRPGVMSAIGAAPLLVASVFFLSPLSEKPEGLLEREVGFTAEYTATVITRHGHSFISGGRFHRFGRQARFERVFPKESIRFEGEIEIYNFETLKHYRVLSQERIYFEAPLQQSILRRAIRDGWTDTKGLSGVSEERIKLKDDQIGKDPSILYLVIRRYQGTGGRPAPQGVSVEYSFLWEKTGTPFPLKIVYNQTDFSTVILEYKNITPAKPDPALFQPPKEFLNLTPF